MMDVNVTPGKQLHVEPSHLFDQMDQSYFCFVEYQTH